MLIKLQGFDCTLISSQGQRTNQIKIRVVQMMSQSYLNSQERIWIQVRGLSGTNRWFKQAVCTNTANLGSRYDVLSFLHVEQLIWQSGRLNLRKHLKVWIHNCWSTEIALVDQSKAHLALTREICFNNWRENSYPRNAT